VTNLAFYRVKYDFNAGSIIHYEKVQLSQIKAIQHGRLVHPAASLKAWSGTESASPMAVRIFTSFETPSWFGSQQPYRTFTPTVPIHRNESLHKGMIYPY